MRKIAISYARGFATLKNVVNSQFACEVRPNVVRGISKSVLSKSRLHKLHAVWKKFWDRNVYKV